MMKGNMHQARSSKERNSGELKAGTDIPLKTVQILGRRETCTRQGVPKRCSCVKAVGMALWSSSQKHDECMGEKKQEKKTGFTFQHPNRRNQVHTLEAHYHEHVCRKDRGWLQTYTMGKRL